MAKLLNTRVKPHQAVFISTLFLRIISRNREVYLLKIVTLAIAFACSTLVILFSFNEFTFDRFHKDYHSVFRVLQRNTDDTYSGNRLSNRIPEAVVNHLRSTDSLITSRVKILDQITVLTENKTFDAQKIHSADPEIARIFSFDFLNESTKRFQEEKNAVILSSSKAIQYFGTIHATGKTIRVNTLQDTLEFSVAGVYQDFPKNSHEEFNVFVSFDVASIKALGFNSSDVAVYVKALSGDVDHCERVMNSLFPGVIVYKFQPISDIYFGPRVLGEDTKHGDSYSLLILICITSLILFLALTSFVNLTTLTLPSRAKELAVKKLAGTKHIHLMFAFAKESFLIVGISLTTGVFILVCLSEFIKQILSIDIITLILSANIFLILILTVLFFILGIAPLFLAVKFTRASPIRLLSSEAITFPRFKRSITFLQLGVSIFLIVSSIVLRRQVNYSLVKEPGRNYDQVIYIRYPADLTPEGLRGLQMNWKNVNANIIDVMATSHLPDQISSKELDSEFYFMTVDPAFKDFFDLEIIHGNWFKANDGDSIILINEKGNEILSDNRANVIGIFRDMSGYFNQPQKPIKINTTSYFRYNYLCIRVLEIDIRKTVHYVTNYFDQKSSVSFLNKRFEQWIKYQDRLNALSEILAIVSALLACCAIYGLSVSIVTDKLKQLAIHKLCGANIISMTRLLVNEFMRQMLIAILIFGPFTYIFLNELLRSFVYSTHFTWLDPVVPLAYCVLVIIILCAFQALGLNRRDLSSVLKA